MMGENKLPRILVAEDEPEVLALMTKHITAAGFDVVTAQDGQEAWEKIGTAKPDVIVMDLNMPRRDGFSVLKELREKPLSSKWQPVIIVSAEDEVLSIKRGYSLEADHYITKPCRMEEILKGIQLMLALIPQRICTEEIK